MIPFLIVLGLFWAPSGFGGFEFHFREDALVQNIEVSSTKGTKDFLWDLLAREKRPTILVPMFAHCPDICPTQVKKLQAVLAQAKERWPVMIFSFAFDESMAELKEFMKTHDLPPDWLGIRASKQATLDFFTPLKYPIMTRKDGYDHQASLYVLSKRGQKLATLYGFDYDPETFLSDLELIAKKTEPGVWGRLSLMAKDFEMVGVIGLWGLLFGGGFLMVWPLVRQKDQSLPEKGDAKS